MKPLHDVTSRRKIRNISCSHSSQNFTLSWRGPLSYRNQSIDLLGKSMDWFLYDNGLCHERVKKPRSGIILGLSTSKQEFCQRILSAVLTLCKRSKKINILICYRTSQRRIFSKKIIWVNFKPLGLHAKIMKSSLIFDDTWKSHFGPHPVQRPHNKIFTKKI